MSTKLRKHKPKFVIIDELTKEGIVKTKYRTKFIEREREMDAESLKKLKGEKSSTIIGEGDPRAIAIMELRIAIAEIERGEHKKALLNIESARRFIDRIEAWVSPYYECPNCGERVKAINGSQNIEHLLQCGGKPGRPAIDK